MSDMKYLEYIDMLLIEFKKEFDEIYTSLKVKNKSRILSFIPEIFNKWCCSAMFEETVLSPYSMIENINNLYVKDGTMIFPVLRSKSQKRYLGLNGEYVVYSLSDHPIVYDIYTITENLYPSIECDENGYVKEEYLQKVINELSTPSYGYFEYLFFLCIKLGIYKKMPSLYTDMYVLDEKKSKEFDGFSMEEALERVTNAAIDLFTESINEFMPDEEVFIDNEFVLKYIKESHTVDEIISDIYNILDIDINEILSKDYTEIEEYDSLLLSTVFALGSIIDKSFLTPFCAYFHYIQPMYLMPLDLMREIDIILSSDLKYEAVDMLLMPAHQYTLTKLAAEKFGIDYNDEYKEMFEKMPVTYILENLEDGLESFRHLKSISKPKIYSFKLSGCGREEYLIEIEEDKNLSDLHRIICQILSMSCFNDYSFYMSDEVNPFNEYTPALYTKIKHNKAELTPLNSFDFKELPMFLYYNFPETRTRKLKKEDCCKIDFLNVHNNDTAFIYPRAMKYYK